MKILIGVALVIWCSSTETIIGQRQQFQKVERNKLLKNGWNNGSKVEEVQRDDSDDEVVYESFNDLDTAYREKKNADDFRAIVDDLSTSARVFFSSYNRDSILRSKRNVDDFRAIVEDLSTSARVVAGISLELGLVDGSVSGDDVIAELLNIGLVNMASLEEFKKEEVTGFFGKLKALDVKDDSGVEGVVLLLNSWRERYTSLGNVKDMTGNDAYFDKMASLKQEHSLDVALLTAWSDYAEKCLSNWVSIKSDLRTNYNPSKKDALYVYFDAGRTSCNGTLIEKQKFKELQERIDKYEALMGGIDERHAELLELFSSYSDDTTMSSHRTDSNIQKFVDNVKLFQQISSEFDAASAEVFQMSQATTRSTNGRNSTRKVTSGLVNGFADLMKLRADSQSPIFRSISLLAGLKPLQQLYEDASSLDQKWQSLKNDKNVKTGRQADGLHSSLKSIQSLLQDPKPVMDDVIKFNLPSNTGGKTLVSTTKSTLQPIDTLSISLRKLKELADEVSQLASDDFMKKVEELRDITLPADANDDSSIRSVFDNLKQFQDNADNSQFFIDLQTLNTKLGDVKSKLEGPTGINAQTSPTGINAQMTNIAGLKQEVSQFVNHADVQEFISLMDGFGSNEDKFRSVVTCAKLVEAVRKLKTDPHFLNDVSATADVILQSIPAVKKVREIPTEIRSSEDVKKLKVLAGVQQESKTFGDAVALLHNVKKLVDQKADFATIKENRDVVRKKTKELKTTEPKLAREVTMGWGEFNVDAVDQMIAELEGKIGSIQKPANTSKLANFAPVFASFQKVTFQPIDLKIYQRLEALEKLIDKFPGVQELSRLQNALKSIDKLDLGFDKLAPSLQQVSGSLSKLDTAFASARVKGTKPPKPSENGEENDQLDSVAGRLGRERTTTEAEFYKSPYFWGSVIGSILILGAFLGFFACYFFKKKEKKKREEKKKEEEKEEEKEKKADGADSNSANSKASADSNVSNDSKEAKKDKEKKEAAVEKEETVETEETEESQVKVAVKPPDEKLIQPKSGEVSAEDVDIDYPMNDDPEAPIFFTSLSLPTMEVVAEKEKGKAGSKPEPKEIAQPEDHVNRPFRAGSVVPKSKDPDVLLHLLFKRKKLNGEMTTAAYILKGAHDKAETAIYVDVAVSTRLYIELEYDLYVTGLRKIKWTEYLNQDFAKGLKDEPLVEPPDTFHRYPHPCVKRLLWGLNGTTFMMKTSKQFKILIENPVTHAAKLAIMKREKLPKEKVVETFNAMIHMAVEQRVEAIVTIYSDEEANDPCSGLDLYTKHLKQGDTIVVPGQFHIHCMNETPLLKTEGRTTRRKLCIRMYRTEEKEKKAVSDRIVYLFALKSWPKDGIPANNEDLRAVLQATMIRKTIVHSMNGTGRCCMFVGIQLFAEYAMSGHFGSNPVEQFIFELRQKRIGAIDTPKQLLFVVLLGLDLCYYTLPRTACLRWPSEKTWSMLLKNRPPMWSNFLEFDVPIKESAQKESLDPKAADPKTAIPAAPVIVQIDPPANAAPIAEKPKSEHKTVQKTTQKSVQKSEQKPEQKPEQKSEQKSEQKPRKDENPGITIPGFLGNFV